MNTIYLLIDPRTGMVRYVGVTRATLHRRLIDHIRVARKGEHTYRSIWIRSLLGEGRAPLIIAIEQTTDRTRECYWIAHYRTAGSPLTNGTSGGDGGSPMLGHRHSEETKEKMREAARTSPAAIAARARLAAHLQGHPVSEEARRKLSVTSRQLWQSPEYRAKNPTSRGSKHSEETKRKMSDVHSKRARDDKGRWR